MVTSDDVIQYIDCRIGYILDRPQMYAPSPESLETLLMELEDLREFILTGLNYSERPLSKYNEYLRQRGFESRTFTSNSSSMPPDEDERFRFREFCSFWQEYLDSGTRMNARLT